MKPFLFGLAVALLTACSTPRSSSSGAPPMETAPVDVWIPDDTPKAEREEIAKALEGHAPPRHGWLPACHTLHRTSINSAEPQSWDSLLKFALSQARAYDGDAIVVTRDDFFVYNWQIVRYERTRLDVETTD